MPAFKPIQSFYAPISAGSMAHTGAIPQSNVSYTTISASPRSGARLVRTSPIQGTVTGPSGYLPVALNNITVPSTRPKGGPVLPSNWVNDQKV